MAPQQARPDFDALRDLHDSANDLLLHSPVIKKTMAYNHGQQKWVHEISEAALRILESCGNTKEVLSLVKDHLQDLQSTFRRIVGGTGVGGDNTFAGFGIQRKKLKKAVLKRLESLKGMKNKKNKKCSIIFKNTAFSSSSSFNIKDDDDEGDEAMFINQELNVVINVLREVRMTTMAIVESLMSLMSMPIIRPNNVDNDDKPNKLLLLGFFESKSRSRVNSTLMMSSWEKCDAVVLQRATKRLEEVEMAIEELEEELECIFRRLIRTRVSLLNILTY